jgi:hypothetical protein
VGLKRRSNKGGPDQRASFIFFTEADRGSQPADEGSIKGDVKKKHFSSFLEEFFSYIQPLCGGKTSYSGAGRVRWHFGLRCSVRAFAPASSGLAVANHGSI